MTRHKDEDGQKNMRNETTGYLKNKTKKKQCQHKPPHPPPTPHPKKQNEKTMEEERLSKQANK